MIIEDILSCNEGKTLEFKESAQSLSGIVKTIIAFANTAGGTIVIGVEDKNKKIKGVENPLLEEERIAGAVADSIMPLLVPDIVIQTYRKKELIVIKVPHAAGPYYLKSAGVEKGAYIRLGSTNRVADKEALQTLRDFAHNIYFDEKPHLTSKANDLDWEVIDSIFQEVKKKVAEKQAENIGLLTKHNDKEFPTNGGIILFGKNRLRFFPDAIIRCARFLGKERISFLDQLDIDTYLPLAGEEAIKFIRRNTSMAAQFQDLRRIDVPEYPPEAIREALVNAVVHADYAMAGTTITIAIFDDRLEITNPGGLPLGLTLEHALSGSSRIRNRVIAKVFHELKLIESWGTGFSKIIDACQKHGLESPKFEERNNQFRVTLYATKQRVSRLEPWEKEFTGHLQKKERVSTKEAAKILGITPRNARIKLKSLVNAGIIRKVGTSLQDPKSGYVLARKV